MMSLDTCCLMLLLNAARKMLEDCSWGLLMRDGETLDRILCSKDTHSCLYWRRVRLVSTKARHIALFSRHQHAGVCRALRPLLIRIELLLRTVSIRNITLFRCSAHPSLTQTVVNAWLYNETRSGHRRCPCIVRELICSSQDYVLSRRVVSCCVWSLHMMVTIWQLVRSQLSGCWVLIVSIYQALIMTMLLLRYKCCLACWVIQQGTLVVILIIAKKVLLII